MLLIREIMYCKPGKVRPLVEKFLAMAKLSAKVGMPKMRVMTDVCSDRYWMLVAEMEVANMAEFERMMQGGGQNSEDMKEFESIMKGYHDLVDHGRREQTEPPAWWPYYSAWSTGGSRRGGMSSPLRTSPQSS